MIPLNKLFRSTQQTTPTNLRTRLGAESLEARDVPATGTGCICGYVYVDADNNGVFDTSKGDKGLAGVNLNLTSDYGLTATVTTDSTGRYCFNNLGVGYHTITETQPAGYLQGTNTPGSPTNGVVSGDTVGEILVLGTCLDGYNFGEVQQPPSTTVSRGDTATVGYWRNNNGQALLKSLNGGPNATQLSAWLSTNFPYLFGAKAGANNVTGMTNTQVAAFFTTLFTDFSPKTEAQILGAAFAVYVTDSDLAGTVATQYGFNVSSTGTGAKTYNVGSSGLAIGLKNNTSYTVYDLLLQANKQKQLGKYNANAFNTIFDGINQKGDIV